MKRLLVFAALLALLFFWVFPYVGVNYRLTLTVETPHSLRTASVVQHEQYSYSHIPSYAGGGNYWDTTGEALVLDLGEDRYLFAVLPQTIAAVSFDDAGRLANWRSSTFGFYRAFLGLKFFTWGAVPVSESSMPTLVSFADINDPATVFLVDPNNMTASLGEGFSFQGMEVEITWTSVTEGAVERVLEWLYDGYTLEAIWSSLKPSQRDLLFRLYAKSR